MTTYTTTTEQAEALAARWNNHATDDAQITAEKAHLLFGDNADVDLEESGQHLVEVPASQSKTGNPQTFYITESDVTAEAKRTFHVIALPTYEDEVSDGTIIGTCSNEEEAIAMCEAEGFEVIREGDGGLYQTYDAEDAPGIYGYEPDGMGAIGITVRPQKRASREEKAMSRNYETPAVDPQWAQSRETDKEVAMAIHAIAGSRRSAEEIWEAPTAAEFENVQMALNEYCIAGDIEPGSYCWGQEVIEVTDK